MTSIKLQFEMLGFVATEIDKLLPETITEADREAIRLDSEEQYRNEL